MTGDAPRNDVAACSTPTGSSRAPSRAVRTADDIDDASRSSIVGCVDVQRQFLTYVSQTFTALYSFGRNCVVIALRPGSGPSNAIKLHTEMVIDVDSKGQWLIRANQAKFVA